MSKGITAGPFVNLRLTRGRLGARFEWGWRSLEDRAAFGVGGAHGVVYLVCPSGEPWAAFRSWYLHKMSE